MNNLKNSFTLQKTHVQHKSSMLDHTPF